MNVFRPAEIRIIVLLCAIVLIGSVFTMLKRQGRISALDLGIFTERKYYKHEYQLPSAQNSESPAMTDAEPPASELASRTFPVNINAAGYYDLQALPGIGPATARNIIAFRDSAGEFDSVERLLEVNGIGPAKLEMLKDKVTLK